MVAIEREHFQDYGEMIRPKVKQDRLQKYTVDFMRFYFTLIKVLFPELINNEILKY
jgi:hypothetical protein